MERVDYSIIIPAYNEEEFLGATLDRVLHSVNAVSQLDNRAIADLIGEVIVVNNNSTDRTEEIAREKGVTVVFEPVNRISKARNIGGKKAKGQFLLFLDADTQLTPELLLKVLEQLQTGLYYGGGAHVAFDLTLPFSARVFEKIWNRYAKFLGWSAGCFFYCLKEAFDAVGGFREEVYAGEEIYFSKRLKRWGKEQGLRFSHFDEPAVVTSSRRIHGKPFFKTFLLLLLLGACPFLMRSKWFCSRWYNRTH